MKKFIWLIMLVFIFIPLKINASCDIAEINELKSVVAHLDLSYDFNYDNHMFNLKINNLNESMYISYGKEKYYPQDNRVFINNLTYGSKITYKVIANCDDTLLKTDSIVLPYYNSFYNSYECIGHEELVVCNSEFLSYDLSRELFLKYIEKDTIKDMDTESENKREEEEKTNDKLDIDLFIKIGMVILGVGLPTFVGKILIDKTKYKF